MSKRRAHPTHSAPYARGESVRGVFQAARRRGGYLVPEAKGGPDLRIPPTDMGTALHGDRVEATVTRAKPGHTPRARVTRILRHANRHIVGQIHHSGRVCVVQPKNPRIQRRVEIHQRADARSIAPGTWVMVEVRRWASGPDEPLIGRVEEVLGRDGEPGLPILLLVRGGGVALDFPEAVRLEAEQRVAEWTATPKAALAGRLDLRGRRVFTIDPATAKDFDDALSLESSGPEGWRVGVHIADVAHFVRPGTALDAEALDRATSIYPVDRVIAMLPESLAEGACSLRPDEDRLTLSVFFTIGRDGAVSGFEFAESVIHSVHRFTYAQAQALFDANDDAQAIPKALRNDLTILHEAARAFGAARRRRGALDLELPEPEIVLDDDGRPVELRRAERWDSHRLVEEMMLAANEAVARELTRRGAPMLYRVHEEPDPARLASLAPALERLGISMPDSPTHLDLQRAFDAAHHHPAARILQRYLLRALPRACYRPDNVGHFGLASECYTHFTSPIRRYPDLLVHRALKAAKTDETGDGGDPHTRWAEWGRHTSAREERAQRIEWDAEAILCAEFMRRHLGDVCDGFISGVAAHGFFVEPTRWPVEGLVPIRTLDDDTYDLDERRMLWQGRVSGRVFALGDPVRVAVERVDVLQGRIDFALVQQRRSGGRPQTDGPSRNDPARRKKRRTSPKRL